MPTITPATDRVLASDLTDGDTLASGVRLVAVRDDGPAGMWIAYSDGYAGYLDHDQKVDVLAYGLA